jgi:hypothetical protein
MEFTYEQIKALAKESGRPVTDLIALASQNDPFYQGTLATRALAEWFAEVYYRQGWDRSRVHIRRCHYALVSLGLTLPNGKPYENTMQCWDTLLIATKAARYLALVDMTSFDDRRNQEPINHVQADYDPAFSVAGYLYTSNVNLPDFPSLPGYSIASYAARQPYHIELWCEKTTMNDVLEPLAEEYGGVVQTGAGELSITAARLLAERLESIGKPTRIFYISDFDPAGQSMPVAVSRKLEYFVRNGGIEQDVRLFPVVLTAEQVRRYRLPRTPIKETESRRAHFESQYGTGAVELDALEALRPGELERILRGSITRYYDTDLDARTRDARRTLERDLDTIRGQVLAGHRDEIAAARANLEAIKADLGPRMEAYSQRIQRLWQAINADLRDREPYIEDYPLPEAQEADELGEGLYNSQRDYLEQIDAYKAFQGKEARS